MEFSVPVKVETERLVLRQFKESDCKSLHNYYSSTIATKYTVARQFTEAETWRSMSAMIGHWHLRGYGPYAIEEKETGTVLGISGFWYPIEWPSPEIKWALAPEYWGKGFASEAARAVQIVGAQYIPQISLISLIHADNDSSINLALAVGAKFEKEILFRDANWHIYRHPSKT